MSSQKAKIENKKDGQDNQADLDRSTEQKSATEKAITVVKEKSLLINGLLLVLSIIFGYLWYSSTNSIDEAKDIGVEKAERKIISFIEENMVQPGTKVSVKGMSVENGLYKAEMEIQGQQAITYLSKDGSTFYPQGYLIEEVESKRAESQEAANVEVPKSEKPNVEVFIMSYCPYGTQIQKGLLPVIETLDKNIDFEFKFVDYAMHGDKEIEENVRQYCISKNEPNKFEDYLSCFLETGNSSGCLEQQAVDSTMLTKCANGVDSEFNVDEKAKNKDEWEGKYPPFDLHKEDNLKYSVQGSPTLVINGTTVQSQRDPASLMKKICDAFENKPEECNETLSSAAPKPGFGAGETSEAASGSCN